MITEAAIAISAAGGTAIVEAASTDLWNTLKTKVAAWMGRGDRTAADAVETELEATSAELATLEGIELDLAKQDHGTRWQRRLLAVIKENPDAEQELRDLLAESPQTAQHITINSVANDNARVNIQGSGHQTNTFN